MVEHKLEEAFETFTADRIGIPDYALDSNGKFKTMGLHFKKKSSYSLSQHFHGDHYQIFKSLVMVVLCRYDIGLEEPICTVIKYAFVMEVLVPRKCPEN